jgi:hypothetical protein
MGQQMGGEMGGMTGGRIGCTSKGRVLKDMPDRALPRSVNEKMTASHVMRNR